MSKHIHRKEPNGDEREMLFEIFKGIEKDPRAVLVLVGFKNLKENVTTKDIVVDTKHGLVRAKYVNWGEVVNLHIDILPFDLEIDIENIPSDQFSLLFNEWLLPLAGRWCLDIEEWSDES